MNDERRLFIYDCNGDIAGNPKGYRTLRGAMQQAQSKHSKTYRELWRRYEEREDKTNRHVWSIE